MPPLPTGAGESIGEQMELRGSRLAGSLVEVHVGRLGQTANRLRSSVVFNSVTAHPDAGS